MEVTATQPAKGPERLGRAGPTGAGSGSAVRSPAAQRGACGPRPHPSQRLQSIRQAQCGLPEVIWSPATPREVLLKFPGPPSG